MTQTKNFTVTETVHHGSYHYVAKRNGDTIEAAVKATLAVSPYNRRSSNIDKLIADLHTTGEGEIGWARYKVAKLTKA